MKKASGSVFALPTGRGARRIRQRKQPKQDRSKETVQAVLEATLQILVRDGYKTLTTTRVAERAGVSVGTLYQYFPDKRSLVTALCVQYFDLLGSSLLEASQRAATLPLEPGVRAIVMALIQVKRDNLALSLAVREPMNEPEGRAIGRDMTAKIAEGLTVFVRMRCKKAEDPALVARVLGASMKGAVEVAVYDDPKLLTHEPFADALTALALGYLERYV